MPADAARLSLDYSKLTQTAISTGIGGQSSDFVAPAMIAFSAPGTPLFLYQVYLRIMRKTEHNEDIPSLLGRDIIGRWRIVFDKPHNVVSADVISADASL
jgi:hypothetical protein